MRITTLLLFAFLISSTLSAQQKGDIMIGGAVSFTKSTNRISDSVANISFINLSPSVGKFYATNRMVGVNAYYSYTQYKTYPYKQRNYGIGVFLRQYKPLGESFYLFAEEGLNVGFNKMERNTYIGNLPYKEIEKNQTVSLHFYPGIAYSITKKLQLELALNQLFSFEYTHGTIDVPDLPMLFKSEGHSFRLNSGFSEAGLGNLSFGIKWLIAG